MNQGILYMAVGDQFIDEATQSARSVHTQMPDIETAIATTQTGRDLSVFNHIIELDQGRQKTVNDRTWLIDSTIDPDLSPFDRTLYLDSDTYVCDDIRELFGLLDDFDLAVARKPEKDPVDGLPEPWHLYNCGVIAYRDSAETREFLKRWKQIYLNLLETQEEPEDQPAFAKALYESNNLQWYTLPREYNVRFPRRGSVSGEVKIVHGRHSVGLKQIARELNSSENIRAFRERSYFFSPAAVVHDRGTARYRFEKNFARYGLRFTLKRTLAYLSDRILGTNYTDSLTRNR